MAATSDPVASPPRQPRASEFPFCFADTADRGDTEAVERWRNRSQYLTRGGWLKYANVIYQYNRGVFGNLLVLSPLLMFMGLALSFAYTWFRHHPFLCSLCLLVVLLVCHALDFISHSDNPSQHSTPLRQFRNLVIFLLGLAFVIEATPQCVELVRSVKPRGSPGISQILGFVAAAASASTVLRSLTPKQLRGVSARLFAVGILSWVIVAMILIGIVDYLYFGIPPYAWFLFIPFVAIGIILGSLAVSIGRRILPEMIGLDDGFAEHLPATLIRHLLFWSIAVGSFLAALRLGIEPYSIACRYSAQKVAEVTRPLGRLSEALPALAANAQGQLPPEAGKLLSRLAEQKRMLDAEFSADWGDEYRALYLGDFLPTTQSLLTHYLLQRGENTANYERVDRSHSINELSLLGPLRPRYHSDAVAFLNSCAAIDDLPDHVKQLLLADVSKHCVQKIAVTLRNRRDVSDALASNRRIISDALLVHHLVARITPVARHGGLSVNEDLLKSLIGTEDPSVGQKAAAPVGSLFAVDDIRKALAGIAVSLDEVENYLALVSADLSPSHKPEGRAAKAALRFRSILEAEAKPLASDTDRQSRILCEALLACLCRLDRAGGGVGVDLVRQALDSLPVALPAADDFGLPRAAAQRYARLMADSPEDLAMIAAGFSRRADTGVAEGFVAESYVADAFRQTVCDAVDRPSDVGLSGRSSVYSITTTGGGGAGDAPAAHASEDDAQVAQLILLHQATLPEAIPSMLDTRVSRDATAVLGELFSADIPTSHRFRKDTYENDLIMIAVQDAPARSARRLLPEIGLRLLAGRLVHDAIDTRHEFDEAMRIVGAGRYGNLGNLRSMVEEIAASTFLVKTILVFTVTLAMLLFALVFIDPNMTSIHRFYRDALSSAFLFTGRPQGDRPGNGPDRFVSADGNLADRHAGLVDAKEVKLSALADPLEGSAWNAPYPLINAAVNVSARGDESIRERNARPFLFSPLYVGGHFGSGENDVFVETTEFEAANPTVTAATAMTISGAAASPFMGRYTNWALRLPMVLSNVRMGYWINDSRGAATDRSRATLVQVLNAEREAITKRRREHNGIARADDGRAEPGIIGLAFSGGGIRSASLNFGIAQGLFRRGIWQFVDYLSTVSGGGYVGTSISIFMRSPPPPRTSPKPSQTSSLPRARRGSAISGTPSCLCLFKELFGQSPFVNRLDNVTDGGHFENLGVYALLQRRCRLIIVGDGEADPKGVLDGLSRLSMLALSDLGVRLEFPDGDLHRIATASTNSERHFTVAKIVYRDNTTGWLIYLRSSVTGDEDEFIRGYKARNADFPHESTTDQFFTEEQFEAYRRLGEHIADEAIASIFAAVLSDHEALISLTKQFFDARTGLLATSPRRATAEG